MSVTIQDNPIPIMSVVASAMRVSDFLLEFMNRYVVDSFYVPVTFLPTNIKTPVIVNWKKEGF